MARFQYRALSPSGDVVTGELEGPSAAAVIERLSEQALLPINAVEKRTERAAGLGGRAGKGMSRRDLALFSQQLARLLKAGLALDRALDILEGLASGKRAKTVVRRTVESVRDGASLAEAMSRQESSFPPSFVSMIRAGEVGGALHPVLSRAADFLVRSEAMRQRVISAMIYPALLTLVAIASVTIVLVAVLPQFASVFEGAGSRLPTSTRLLMSASDWLSSFWWAIPIGFLVLALAGQRIVRQPSVARSLDQLWLALPIVRDLVTKYEVGRFSRTLGTLLGNGVPATRALSLCSQTMKNRILIAAVDAVEARFKQGEGLSAPLARAGRFPAMAVQMVRIGEETGRLEDMLQELADIYDQDIQRTLDRLLAMLVPGITILMGSVIALIIASVMTALISINDLAL